MGSNEKMGISVAEMERAIVAAVAPPNVRELNRWIAAFDDGTVSRARSAAPLSHDVVDAAAVGEIHGEYVARGLEPLFRVPDLPQFAPGEAGLARLGPRGK